MPIVNWICCFVLLFARILCHASPVGANAPDAKIKGSTIRKKYPQPPSFQQRMVLFSLNPDTNRNTFLLESNDLDATKLAGRVQLEQMTQTIPGYKNIGFDLLSGYEFKLNESLVNQTSPSIQQKTQIPDLVTSLHQQKVAIRGFILPLKTEESKTTEFLLMRNQNLCCFGSIPRINEWITVRYPPGAKPLLDRACTVLGRIEVGEFRDNGVLVDIYRLNADLVQQ